MFFPYLFNKSKLNKYPDDTFNIKRLEISLLSLEIFMV
jgi:hypothetical protein